jgi:nicotinamide mononucleotide (NMN) deamidase PncC
VRAALGANVGLSVSGIAGPGGGTPEKPVGTVWVGFSTPWGDRAFHFLWSGDRIANKADSAQAALQILVDELKRHVVPD